MCRSAETKKCFPKGPRFTNLGVYMWTWAAISVRAQPLKERSEGSQTFGVINSVSLLQLTKAVTVFLSPLSPGRYIAVNKSARPY